MLLARLVFILLLLAQYQCPQDVPSLDDFELVFGRTRSKSDLKKYLQMLIHYRAFMTAMRPKYLGISTRGSTLEVKFETRPWQCLARRIILAHLDWQLFNLPSSYRHSTSTIHLPHNSVLTEKRSSIVCRLSCQRDKRPTHQEPRSRGTCSPPNYHHPHPRLNARSWLEQERGNIKKTGPLLWASQHHARAILMKKANTARHIDNRR